MFLNICRACLRSYRRRNGIFPLSGLYKNTYDLLAILGKMMQSDVSKHELKINKTIFASFIQHLNLPFCRLISSMASKINCANAVQIKLSVFKTFQICSSSPNQNCAKCSLNVLLI